MKNNKLFDPLWRDDVYDKEALEVPLLLPYASEPSNGVWVGKRVMREEEIFGDSLKHKKPRIITALVKRSEDHRGVSLTDSEGNKVPDDSPIWDIIDPPKAWMSDKAEELMTMYAAARVARGDVLVGGLGMGIFPQMAFHLGRPVDSFTIIEKSHEVIEITTESWLNRMDSDKREKIEVVETSFEDYIKTTGKKFDTIFVDIWQDSDPRFLPYMNRLVELLEPLCKKGGRIYLWAYAMAVDSFVKLVNYYERNNIDVQLITMPIDPLLAKYGEWRAREENAGLPMEEYEKKARELALSEKLNDLKYDRNLYFFPFAASTYERQIIRKILHLARRDRDEDDEDVEPDVRKVSDES
jgi:hypothetical protein